MLHHLATAWWITRLPRVSVTQLYSCPLWYLKDCSCVVQRRVLSQGESWWRSRCLRCASCMGHGRDCAKMSEYESSFSPFWEAFFQVPSLNFAISRKGLVLGWDRNKLALHFLVESSESTSGVLKTRWYNECWSISVSSENVQLKGQHLQDKSMSGDNSNVDFFFFSHLHFKMEINIVFEEGEWGRGGHLQVQKKERIWNSEWCYSDLFQVSEVPDVRFHAGSAGSREGE